MTVTIKKYLTKIHLGAEQSFQNLSIFPLLSDYSIPFDFLTIDDAVSKDLVEMVEIQQNGSTHKDNQYHGQDHDKASRDYLDHFARVDSQVGVLFMISGKVAGMECFGRSEVLKATFMKMIESYAKTAIDRFDTKINLRSSKAEAINFLQMAKESRVHIKQSARLAARWMLKSKRCTGYALAHEDQVLRLSMVAKN